MAKPRILLISSSETFSNDMVSELANSCEVTILHLHSKQKHLKDLTLGDNRQFEYLLLFCFSQNVSKFYKNTVAFLDKLNRLAVSDKLKKCVLITPFLEEKNKQFFYQKLFTFFINKKIIIKKINIPLQEFASNESADNFSKQLFLTQVLPFQIINGDPCVYVCKSLETIDFIKQTLFSLDNTSKEINYLTKPTYLKSFLNNQKIALAYKKYSHANVKHFITSKASKDQYFASDILNVLKERFAQTNSAMSTSDNDSQKTQFYLANLLRRFKFIQNFDNKKILVKSAMVLVGVYIFTLPILFACAYLFSTTGLALTVIPNRTFSNMGFKTGEVFADSALAYYSILEDRHLLHNVFKQIRTYDLFTLTKQSAKAYLAINALSTDFTSLDLKDRKFPTASFARNSYLELDVLANTISYAQSDYASSNKLAQSLFASFLNSRNINRTKEVVITVREIVKELPVLIGESKPVSYLLLIMGDGVGYESKLVKLATLDFSGGELSNILVYDLESLGNSSKGQIDPPAVLKDNFGVTDWGIKNIGWEKDFKEQSQRALLLFEKDTGKKVDGVIAIKEQFLYALALKNKKLVSSSLGFSASNNFADRLTEIVNRGDVNVVGVFLELLFKEGKKFDLYDGFFKQLESGGANMFLVDEKLQENLTKLGWGGEIRKKDCGGRCFSDLLVSTEDVVANSTDVKINKYAELAVFVEKGVVKKELLTFYTNTSSANVKLYARVFTLPDTGFGSFEIASTNDKFLSDADFRAFTNSKEAGVVLELPAGKTKVVKSVWENGIDLSAVDKYYFEWRRVGNLGFPVKITLTTPQDLQGLVRTSYNPNLTKDGVYTYNTESLEDFYFEVEYK